MVKKQRPGPATNDSPERQLRLISESLHPAAGSLKGGVVSLYFNSGCGTGRRNPFPSGVRSGRTQDTCSGSRNDKEAELKLQTSGSGAKDPERPRSRKLPVADWVSGVYGGKGAGMLPFSRKPKTNKRGGSTIEGPEDLMGILGKGRFTGSRPP